MVNQINLFKAVVILKLLLFIRNKKVIKLLVLELKKN